MLGVVSAAAVEVAVVGMVGEQVFFSFFLFFASSSKKRQKEGNQFDFPYIGYYVYP